MIYLYALAAATTPAPGVPGIAGAPVTVTTVGDVAAFYSRHRRFDAVPDAPTLWIHESVVEAAMASGPVLPCRFGSTMGDEAEMIDMVERHSERIGRGLRHVEGRLELAVRATRRVGSGGKGTDAPAHAGSGRSYLYGRLRQQRELDERRGRIEPVARTLDGALRPIASDARVDVVPEPVPAVTAAYLVDDHDVDVFIHRTQDLARLLPEVDMVCTGPWPPYSFVPDLSPGAFRFPGRSCG
ncbi:MAG TPA: GvpL/GvpF family gas vesicle protein [Acidimicrobiales bacterium]|nr:GvpL/GvpF family gas vesicle protein [Acidimicrobiales bacterium]